MPLVRWIHFPPLGDDRGSLVALESEKTLPFAIQRVYYLSDTKPQVSRGFHAHKKLHQVAVCVKGRCRMELDDGYKREEVWLDSSIKGIELPPLIWHEMHDFSTDCVLLVLASEHYEESDYIRSYQDFLNLVRC